MRRSAATTKRRRPPAPAGRELSRIEAAIRESLARSSRGLAETAAIASGDTARAASAIVAALRRGNKLLACGNGGSAADSQHVAAELVVRFRANRRALPAIALTTDSSVLTAEANDRGFVSVFSRQVEALGAPGDVLLAISTSGSSPNILKAVAAARRRGLVVIGLTGPQPCRMDRRCDICIKVAGDETCRVQESHLAIEHLLCRLAEERLTGPRRRQR